MLGTQKHSFSWQPGKFVEAQQVLGFISSSHRFKSEFVLHELISKLPFKPEQHLKGDEEKRHSDGTRTL